LKNFTRSSDELAGDCCVLPIKARNSVLAKSSIEDGSMIIPPPANSLRATITCA
jgi:hypothetical protein